MRYATIVSRSVIGHHQNIGRNIQRLCQLFDDIETDISLPILNFTQIRPLYGCFERKLLLRPTLIFTGLSNISAEDRNQCHARKLHCGSPVLYPL